ncbi:MAG: glyoxalase [Gammaproteobacteria bacterium]|nr:glyoxalase [Gammaproteobacteria bacterium]
MILSVHHAQITIPTGTEDQARGFYCGLLGLGEITKPENLNGRGGFWMQLPNLQVHVGTEDGFDRTKTKAHVAYAVGDLATVRELLVSHGIEPQDGLPIPGYDRFECRDPFGNRMEFIQRINDK